MIMNKSLHDTQQKMGALGKVEKQTNKNNSDR